MSSVATARLNGLIVEEDDDEGFDPEKFFGNNNDDDSGNETRSAQPTQRTAFQNSIYTPRDPRTIVVPPELIKEAIEKSKREEKAQKEQRKLARQKERNIQLSRRTFTTPKKL